MRCNNKGIFDHLALHITVHGSNNFEMDEGVVYPLLDKNHSQCEKHFYKNNNQKLYIINNA